jgi:hypothetical protein
MFAGKARSLPTSGAPERYFFTQVSSGLIPKHQTRLERHARNKRSSLLLKGINYARNKFYNIGLRPRSNKNFTVVIYDCSKINKSVIMFAVAAGIYLLYENNRLVYLYSPLSKHSLHSAN